MFDFDFTDLRDEASSEDLIGTWASFSRFGRQEYKIGRSEEGELRFQGPDARGGQLSGALTGDGKWYGGQLSTGNGQKVGRIRVSFVEDDGSIVLNFKCSEQAEWGQDIRARREGQVAVAWAPSTRVSELLIDGGGTGEMSAKERAKLQQLAEHFNPRVNVWEHIAKFGRVESFHCDDAYEDPGEALVLKPTDRDVGPAPVLLLLLGNGHVDCREPLEKCGLDVMLQNPELRTRFYIIVPKPSTRTGLVRFTGNGWEKEWNEDAVWFIFTKILRRLGAKGVDPGRLYATGISMGARGVWHMALKYGDMLAAAAPISGQCYWPNDSWSSGRLPRPDVMEKLVQLPFRAYQIDVDFYAGNPLRDIEWLTWGLDETRKDLKLNYANQSIEVQVREWCHADGGAPMELWWVKGPLQGEEGIDDHRLWLWVYEKKQWGLTQFFLKHSVPDERQWTFSSKPISVDTSAEKAALEALWARLEGADEAEERRVAQSLVAELYGAEAQTPAR